MNPVLAADIASHHHYSILAVFILGYIVHAWLQVDAIARSKDNPIESRMFIVGENAARLAARFFVSLCIFLFVWKNPSAVPTVLGYLGVSLSANAIAVMTLPMSPPIGGIMGFAVDSLLAYVPMLKNALPPIEFTRTETTVKRLGQQPTVTRNTVIEETSTAATQPKEDVS